MVRGCIVVIEQTRLQPRHTSVDIRGLVPFNAMTIGVYLYHTNDRIHSVVKCFTPLVEVNLFQLNQQSNISLDS